ncbi:DUF1493 family protein [Pantoea anthophila]|uniref:DUF1493 family protein n=1 Tax=Pantoea anthophila TaxID=470931 RepID=UPI0006152AFA|nr:DUF1493 family protein [Pantoea anthophila]KKB03520.1 acyl carrier protein [Pantoea anthophila]
MVIADIEQAVFDLVESYNGRSLFTLRRFQLRHDTDLNKDFRMDPLDAYDLMEKFAEKFDIEPSDINFTYYFPDYGDAPEPLTIQLLIDSAKAGKWLGEK